MMRNWRMGLAAVGRVMPVVSMWRFLRLICVGDPRKGMEPYRFCLSWSLFVRTCVIAVGSAVGVKVERPQRERGRTTLMPTRSDRILVRSDE